MNNIQITAYTARVKQGMVLMISLMKNKQKNHTELMLMNERYIIKYMKSNAFAVNVVR